MRIIQGINAVITNIISVQARKGDDMIHKTGVVTHGESKVVMVIVTNQVLSATGTKETPTTVIVVAMIVMNFVASTGERSRMIITRTSVIALITGLVNTCKRSVTVILKTLTRISIVIGHTERSLTTKTKIHANVVTVVAVVQVLMYLDKEKTTAIKVGVGAGI